MIKRLFHPDWYTIILSEFGQASAMVKRQVKVYLKHMSHGNKDHRDAHGDR